MSEAPGERRAPAQVGALARIPGAFLSPRETFDSIARRPTWLAPLLLWIAVSLAVAMLLAPRMDFERMTRERIEKSGRTLPEDQIQSIVERQKRFGAIFGYVGAVLGPLLLSLIVATVLWGAFKAFGWDTSFHQALGVTTHAFLPGVISALLLLPLLPSRDKVDPQAMGDMVRSNLGFLVERDSSKLLHSLLQSIDLFSFWSLLLFVIGFAAAAKIPRKSAAAVIVTLWLLYVSGKAGLAALF
jgi:hypothetical protein